MKQNGLPKDVALRGDWKWCLQEAGRMGVGGWGVEGGGSAVRLAPPMSSGRLPGLLLTGLVHINLFVPLAERAL